MKIRYVKVNEPFEILLTNNPSSGYTWKYKEIEGLKLILLSETVDNPVNIGSSTTAKFVFRAEKSGEYKLELKKFRSWESNGKIEYYEEIISVE